MDDELMIDELEENVINNDDDVQEQIQDSEQPHISSDSEFISQLLRQRGIEDRSSIKFETEEGEIEEKNWDLLTDEERFNILQSSVDTSADLDDEEIMLLNTIRSNNLTPSEYIRSVQNASIQQYVQNNDKPKYSVDEYSDEELYVMDLINRTEDLTEEEALEALERAKQNETLFQKQINATRNEYRKAEQDSIQYTQMQQQEAAKERFNQFANTVKDSIYNFKEFAGYDLNMEDDDMDELYNFITGFDNAGNSWFGKALNDPNTLVKMAWFALNGEKMIQDITDYYNKEITNVRKNSYNNGLKNNNNNNFAYKPKKDNINSFDDLDEI